jgi:hypothetical protein
MQIISIISAGLVITAGFGKIERIGLHPITPDNLLLIPPERGTTNRRLAWILENTRAHL